MPRKPNTQDLTTLARLLMLEAGSHHSYVTTSQLGEALGVTQQAASSRLVALEKSGFIERVHSGRGLSVRLTGSGLKLVRSFYADLSAALEPLSGELTITGKVFTGLREGAYYVSLPGYARPFKESLGFVPFPGTLNLRLAPPQAEQRTKLKLLKGVTVSGFEDRRRTYGPVKCFRAKVRGRLQGAVLAIERTHYDDSVLEVISPLNLRKALKLSDGDELSVTVLPE